MGPARTTLSAVAEQAGVSRPTLYSHFPDDVSLFQACTMHWMSQDPPPDPTRWWGITDPGERVSTALAEVYAHYGRNEQMIDNVFRDMHVVDAMKSFNKPLVEESLAAMTEVLVVAFGDRPDLAVKRRAVVSLAISFETWKSLVRNQRLSEEEAVGVMRQAIQCVTHNIDS